MPKNKKVAKGKLSPAERSQIAKDRWAKIRESKKTPAPPPGHVTKGDVMDDLGLQEPTPAAPIAEQEAAVVNGFDEALSNTPNDPPPPTHYVIPVVAPAPQLAPVAPKKQKRYTGPKEFSVALKAAENRLAKAIVERAQASGQLAMLQAEIPSLIQIINALKGQQNVPAVPYDFSGQNAQFYQPRMPQPVQPDNPLSAIQAAMDAANVAPPVSRAIGNAVQFGPDVVGSLEGPDDDEDRYLGSSANEKGWIGA